MGVPQIPGVQNGDGNPLYTWNYSNKSDTLRFGALVALSNLPSASPLDILVFGEVKAMESAALEAWAKQREQTK